MAQLARQLHIRFAGRSYDLTLGQLGLAPQASDHEVRMAVAQHLEVGLDRLEPYVVERHRTGNVTLRPEAVFG